jgi:hypothetical protein
MIYAKKSIIHISYINLIIILCSNIIVLFNIVNFTLAQIVSPKLNSCGANQHDLTIF